MNFKNLFIYFFNALESFNKFLLDFYFVYQAKILRPTLIKLLLLFVCITFSSKSVTQNSINKKANDSLTILLNTIKEDNQKLDIIINYCKENIYKNPKSVITIASKGIFLSEQLGDSLVLANLLRYKGRMQRVTGEMQQSLENLNKSKQISIAINDSIGISDSYARLGFYFDSVGDIKASEENYLKALQIAINRKAYKEIAGIKCSMAVSLNRRGEFQKAISVYDSILVLSREHNLDTIRIIRNKAQSLTKVGRYEEALDIYFKQKSMHYEDANLLLFAQMDHNIGFILKLNKLNTEALSYYRPIYDYFKNGNDILHLASVSVSLGELELELNNLDKAESYLKEGLEIRKKNGLGRLGTALENLGVVKQKQKKYVEAKNYLLTALNSYREVENHPREASALNHISQLYFELGNHTKSFQYADSARTVSISYKLEEKLSIALSQLITISKKQERYEEAFAFQKKLDSLNLKLKDPEKLFKISQKIVQQKFLENEKENTIKNSQQSRLWPWILLLILAGLVITVYLYLLKKKTTKISSSIKQEYLSNEEAHKLQHKLEDVILKKKPYLNEDLKLKDLANQLSTTDKKLSSLLNQHLDISFYDYINSFRIKEFQCLVNTSSIKDFSISGLAYQCGFKSKSSFYRVFKKEFGISPSEFIKKLPLK